MHSASRRSMAHSADQKATTGIRAITATNTSASAPIGNANTRMNASVKANR